MKKKPIVLSSIVVLIITVATIVVISCDKVKQTETIKNDTSLSQTAKKHAPTNICDCQPKPTAFCPTFKSCASRILANKDSRSFTITWTSCTGCGAGTPPKTTGKICYTGVCGELNLELDGLPDCYKTCYGTSQQCIKITKITCNSTSYSMQFQSDDGTQSVTITGDPHITIQCNPIGGISVVCDGNLTWD
ncbi:MAG TPA: hypothetical protein VN026_10905 [Bacteroidia bacterium]|nr:hypothetical protein [Bacteroidia bacterium]